MANDGAVSLGVDQRGYKKPLDSSTPIGGSRIADLINSTHTWEIRPIVADPTLQRDPDFPRGNADHPSTISTDTDTFPVQNPITMTRIQLRGRKAYRIPGTRKEDGTGGLIFVPTTKATTQFGYYDKAGNKQYVGDDQLDIILGHELVGHASFMDEGREKPIQGPKAFARTMTRPLTQKMPFVRSSANSGATSGRIAVSTMTPCTGNPCPKGRILSRRRWRPPAESEPLTVQMVYEGWRGRPDKSERVDVKACLPQETRTYCTAVNRGRFISQWA
jgi:hypothetical protein